MGNNEKGAEETRPRRRDIESVILRVIGRGIAVDGLTLGQVLDIEQEAFNRDRIYWACAAQDPSLLPKQTPRPGTGAAKLAAAVQRAKNES